MPLPPIIFEDDALVAFDLPRPMNARPDSPDLPREELMPLIRSRYGEGVVNVHRLDPEATGIFLCAKTKPALDFLSGQFQSKTAVKKYVALVVVLPVERAMKNLAGLRDASGPLGDAFTIDLPLRVDEHDRKRFRVGKGGDARESVTEFNVLERFGRFAWIECQPVTSRMHQLRVHLAALGTPVLNDVLYGDPGIKLLLSDLKRGYKGRDEERPLVTGLALHAHELTVKHPASREPLTLTASLPRELEIALKHLRRFR